VPDHFKKLLAVALKPEWSFLKQELKIKIHSPKHQLYTLLGSENLGLIQTGLGSENTQARLENFFHSFTCDSILNFGSCGALNPQFKTGDLFLAHNILNEKKSLNIVSSLTDSLETHFQKSKIEYFKGNLFSSHNIIENQNEKISISHNFNCRAVDMEAFEVAELCREHQTEFLCVKAIFDEFQDDLTNLGNVNRPRGELNGAQLAANLIKSPKLMLKLPELKAKMQRVNQNLAKVVRWYLTYPNKAIIVQL
jgi:nucleoside phosphorylase